MHGEATLCRGVPTAECHGFRECFIGPSPTQLGRRRLSSTVPSRCPRTSPRWRGISCERRVWHRRSSRVWPRRSWTSSSPRRRERIAVGRCVGGGEPRGGHRGDRRGRVDACVLVAVRRNLPERHRASSSETQPNDSPAGVGGPSTGPMTGNTGGPMPLAKPAATWSHLAGKRHVDRPVSIALAWAPAASGSLAGATARADTTSRQVATPPMALGNLVRKSRTAIHCGRTAIRAIRTFCSWLTHASPPSSPK